MYDNNKVGKRMMEVAQGQRNWIRGISLVAGASIAICGFFAEYLVVLLVCLFGGILTAVAGWVVAEAKTIKLYGLGVMVDRMENLRPDLFVDGEERAITADPRVNYVSTTGAGTDWVCPACGFRNPSYCRECDSCGTLKQ